MKIQIGSRVRFLNDTGGGVVKGFTSDEMVLVENDDGFEIPVQAGELIIDKPMVYGFDGEIQPRQSEKEIERKEQPEITFEDRKYLKFKGEVALALVPENEKLLHVSNFSLYLVNDSNYHFSYVISFTDKGIATLISNGSIDPDTKLEIASYSQNSIGKLKEFIVQGIFFKPGLSDIVKVVHEKFDISGISFYKTGHFSDNDYFKKKALVLKKEEKFDMKKAVEKIQDPDIYKAKQLRDQPKEKTQEKVAVPGLVEVDLHIEEIVDDARDMSNSEIIRIQLSRFETALETAMRAKTQKIVFIHGVGNGKLKHELRKQLDRKYPDLKYQDASFKEYGYGATLVYLK